MDPELLELQEKFLAGNIESSVKVGKKSLFSQRNTTAKSPVPIVVPEKITTSDNLFDGVLTNVLEREDSNEVFKARPFQVGGFPNALHRSLQPMKGKMPKSDLEHESYVNVEETSEILKVDQDENLARLNSMSPEEIELARAEVMAGLSQSSIEYLLQKSKKRDPGSLIDSAVTSPHLPEPTEESNLERLKWTDHEIAEGKEDTNLNALRFDLSGRIIKIQGTQSDYSGLFHHGAESEKAGYTILELLHLSKSSFSSQRALAFKTLGLLTKCAYIGDLLDLELIEVLESLSSSNALFSARIGLDAKHETVIDSALEFLAISLGWGQNQFALFDDLMTVGMGKRLIALERPSLLSFGEKSADQAEGEELDSSVETIMHILKKDAILGLVMSSVVVRLRYLLEDERANPTRKLQILFVLSCIAIHSPSSAEDILSCTGLIDTIHQSLLNLQWPATTEYTLTYLSNASRLLRFLSQSSREACVALNNYHILEDMMKFITILPNESNLLFIPALGALGQIFMLLDISFSYGIAGSILDKFRTLFFQFGEKYSLLIIKGNDGETIVKTMAVWARLLVDSLTMFSSFLDAGGEHDAFAPFISIIFKTLDNTGIKPLHNLNAACLNLLTTYVSQTLLKPQTSTFSLSFIEKYSNLVSKMSRASSLIIPPQNSQEKVPVPEEGVGLLHSTRIKTGKQLVLETLQCSVLSEICIGMSLITRRRFIEKEAVVEMIEQSSISRNVAIIMFNISSTRDWIRYFAQVLKTHKTSLDAKLCNAVAWKLIKCLLPGDDFILMKALKHLNLSSAQLFLKSISSSENMQISQNMYNFDIEHPPRSFLIQAGHTQTSSVPLADGWLYRFPIASRASKSSCELQNLCSWLEFIELAESCSLPAQVEAHSEAEISFKFYSLMHVFLLSNKDGEAHFRDERVRGSMKRLLIALLTKHPNAMIIDSGFYNLYQDLIEQYQAVSFGDSVFARYLLLPCSAAFPCDYRLAFWSKMSLYLRGITLKVEDLAPQNLECYLQKDKNKDLMGHYRMILIERRVDSVVNLVLWNIANSNIA